MNPNQFKNLKLLSIITNPTVNLVYVKTKYFLNLNVLRYLTQGYLQNVHAFNLYNLKVLIQLLFLLLYFVDYFFCLLTIYTYVVEIYTHNRLYNVFISQLCLHD